MIRRMVILSGLTLALATVVIGVFSCFREIVCWGKGAGVIWSWKGLPEFVTPDAFVTVPPFDVVRLDNFVRLKSASRASFVRGTFTCFWTVRKAVRVPPSNREINGHVFRWQRSETILLRNGPDDSTVLFVGMAPNQLIVPLWGPLVLLLAYPALAVIRGPLRRYRRRKKGLCTNCGYNLTGNVSGVCPECGEPI